MTERERCNEVAWEVMQADAAPAGTVERHRNISDIIERERADARLHAPAPTRTRGPGKERPTLPARPDGGVCRDCGGMTVPTGACSTCTACGSTGGCG